MSTMAERTEKLKELFEDKGANLSFGEKALYLYHHMLFEMAVRRRQKAHTSCEKHARWLNTSLEVYAFRKRMTDI